MPSVQAMDRDQIEQMVTPCGDGIDPAQIAKTAGLRYASYTMPGIRRKRAGKHFSYIGLDGKSIRDKDTLLMICFCLLCRKRKCLPPSSGCLTLLLFA